MAADLMSLLHVSYSPASHFFLASYMHFDDEKNLAADVTWKFCLHSQVPLGFMDGSCPYRISMTSFRLTESYVVRNVCVSSCSVQYTVPGRKPFMNKRALIKIFPGTRRPSPGLPSSCLAARSTSSPRTPPISASPPAATWSAPPPWWHS